MKVRPGISDPKYIHITDDFFMINREIGYYEDYVKAHPLLKTDNLNKEIERVTKSWQRGSGIAGRSLDGDISMLHSSVEDIRITAGLQISFINLLIGNSLDYFNELLSDNLSGYIDNPTMKRYMQLYKESIDKAEAIGLQGWNKPPIEKIQKKIAEILN